VTRDASAPSTNVVEFVVPIPAELARAELRTSLTDDQRAVRVTAYEDPRLRFGWGGRPRALWQRDFALPADVRPDTLTARRTSDGNVLLSGQRTAPAPVPTAAPRVVHRPLRSFAERQAAAAAAASASSASARRDATATAVPAPSASQPSVGSLRGAAEPMGAVPVESEGDELEAEDDSEGTEQLRAAVPKDADAASSFTVAGRAHEY
jgi:hypothetical protein